MAELKRTTNKHIHVDETIQENERTMMAGPITFTNLTANGAITVLGDLTVTANLNIVGNSALVRIV